MEKIRVILSAELLVFVMFSIAEAPPSANLSLNFYDVSCPSAELMVRNTVRSASSVDPTTPGKLLRLLFHDCLVEGCDASVLLQGNRTEQSDPANNSLGGFSVIDSAKGVLEVFCPGTVSCADILALAARDAVETMIKIFSSKGLSLEDLVTLSGAHTIGIAHCSAFSDRFEKDSKGNLTLIDSSLDGTYAEELMKRCPAGASLSVTVHNDPETSFVFDNQYYQNLQAHKGLFQSDSALFSDNRTRKQVDDFANDQVGFFESWGQSFLKLTSIGVKTGDEGEIRRSCSATNM
ncbi:Peroxidase 46 [Morella rubra]|uniref:Peroxidase n=1 Tax=Morella rubra TaxID=262757 RepID=A0A6A1UWH2_9ROSI|nr:Peroxidase 46 [Morella rubra]